MAGLTAESSTIAQEDDTEVYTGISKVKDIFERKSSGQIGSSVMGKENKGGKYFEKANYKEREKKVRKRERETKGDRREREIEGGSGAEGSVRMCV